MLAVEKSYIAGLIDGEGCIHAWQPTKRASIETRLRVAMCSRPVLLWAQAVTKMGSLYVRRREGMRDLYIWEVSSCDAAVLLKDVLPYMKVKHKQAKMYGRLVQLKAKRKFLGRRGTQKHMPEEQNRLVRAIQKDKRTA